MAKYFTCKCNVKKALMEKNINFKMGSNEIYEEIPEKALDNYKNLSLNSVIVSENSIQPSCSGITLVFSCSLDVVKVYLCFFL